MNATLASARCNYQLSMYNFDKAKCQQRF